MDVDGYFRFYKSIVQQRRLSGVGGRPWRRGGWDGGFRLLWDGWRHGAGDCCRPSVWRRRAAVGRPQRGGLRASATSAAHWDAGHLSTLPPGGVADRDQRGHLLSGHMGECNVPGAVVIRCVAFANPIVSLHVLANDNIMSGNIVR